MFQLGAGEIFLILVLALVIFGPSKLPEVGKAVGRAIHEFKAAVSGEAERRATPPRESGPDGGVTGAGDKAD